MIKHLTFRVAALLVFAAGLAACDMFSTLIDGWKYASAVETDLEESTGMKPEVGFKWRNGRLETRDCGVSPDLRGKTAARICRDRAPRGCQSIQTNAP